MTKSSGQVADKDCESDKVQGEVTDAFVVSSLVNMGEGLSFGDGGDAASVPSAEDGLNLWGTTDGEELEAVAQETPTLTQVMMHFRAGHPVELGNGQLSASPRKGTTGWREDVSCLLPAAC